MGGATDFFRRVARRARRGFRKAEQQVRKLPGVPPMKPEDISARHWDAYATAGESPQWTQHPLIEMAVYRRITGGTNKYWLNWILEDKLEGRFERALSLACGTGGHELIMAHSGRVARIDAFDLSPKSVAIARENARNAGIDCVNFFEAGFDNFDSKLGDATFDLVCFFGSLHHVREIDTVLAAVHRRMTPGGRLVFNEYTGDCYTILDERKVATINRLLEALDPVFLNPDRPRYVNPSLDAMLAGDPSEGVRAALILPFLRHRFDIELLRPFGGAVLHMLYRCLDHRKMTDGSPESESIVRLLIEADRVLYEDAAWLPSDFHVGICRKR
jgi:ubiquinone/menaquinone biosynthesis C-methylase UbiE